MTDKEKLQNVQLLLLKKKINALQTLIWYVNQEAEKSLKLLSPETKDENIVLTFSKEDYKTLKTFLQEARYFSFSSPFAKGYTNQIDEINSILKEIV